MQWQRLVRVWIWTVYLQTCATLPATACHAWTNKIWSFNYMPANYNCSNFESRCRPYWYFLFHWISKQMNVNNPLSIDQVASSVLWGQLFCISKLTLPPTWCVVLNKSLNLSCFSASTSIIEYFHRICCHSNRK